MDLWGTVRRRRVFPEPLEKRRGRALCAAASAVQLMMCMGVHPPVPPFQESRRAGARESSFGTSVILALPPTTLKRDVSRGRRRKGITMVGMSPPSAFCNQLDPTVLQNQCSRPSSQCANAQILRIPGSWPPPLSEINRARAPPLLDLLLFRLLITCRGIFFPGSGRGWSLFI